MMGVVWARAPPEFYMVGPKQLMGPPKNCWPWLDCCHQMCCTWLKVKIAFVPRVPPRAQQAKLTRVPHTPSQMGRGFPPLGAFGISILGAFGASTRTSPPRNIFRTNRRLWIEWIEPIDVCASAFWHLVWSWPQNLTSSSLFANEPNCKFGEIHRSSLWNTMSTRTHWTDEAESRHRLWSGSCPRLIVPRTRLSTVGDRSFHVTVARAWNSLPTSITALTSLPSFKRQL